jgi:hypothetical protein
MRIEPVAEGDVGLRLGADVDHVGLSGGVEVGQVFGGHDGNVNEHNLALSFRTQVAGIISS